MNQKHRVAHINEFAQTNPLSIQVEDVELVGVLSGETVSVFEGRCPHQGTLLAEGSVDSTADGAVLTCRSHGWQFDCLSGARRGGKRSGLKQFTTLVENEAVYVDLDEIRTWKQETSAHVKAGPVATRTIDDLPGPKGWPVVGNAFQINPKQFHIYLENWEKIYGSVYRIQLGPRQIVVTSDPELTNEVLRNRPQTYRRARNLEARIRELGINGVFSAEGEDWRRQRLLVMQALDTKHLHKFFPAMVTVTERLQTLWRQAASEEQSIEVQKDLLCYTVDITTNLAFGYDMNTLEQESDELQQNIGRIFAMLAQRLFSPFPYWHYVKMPADHALDKSINVVRGVIGEFIETTRAKMCENPVIAEQPNNLLEAMLAAQDEEDRQFSNDEIYGNVFTMLLAGEDTTANTIAWMLYYMSKYPDVQQKMQEEADRVLGDATILTDEAKVRELPYIDAVAHETMRFKPVAAVLSVECNEDVVLGDLALPKGSVITTLPRSGAMRPDSFEQPDDFQPDRWLDVSRQVAAQQRKSFIPFGSGPRLCPGRSLALYEIRMAMAMLCRNFDVLPAKESGRHGLDNVQERFSFTMMPTDLFVKFRVRA
ncbi:MAG: cytochrome P450 [Chloroflexota bacterium]